MSMPTLTIDTSVARQVTVSLERDGVTDTHTVPSAGGHSQAVVPAVREILDRNGVGQDEAVRVEVSPGPGSFTGLRVGAAVGAVVAWMTGGTVNGHEAGVPVDLTYDGDRWG